MSKQDVIEVEGIVREALPNAQFKVELQNGHMILAVISGKLKGMILSESQTFSKENVRQVQGNQEKRQDSGYLRKPEAQAASGLSFFPRVLRRGGIIYREFSRERFDIFRTPRNFLSGQSADLKFKIYFLLNMEVQLNGSYSRC